MKLKQNISMRYPPGRAVSPLTAARSSACGGAHGVTRPAVLVGSQKSRFGKAFTLVEILVVVALLSFIVLALMAVFNTTQTAFRASLTQTDILEGGRNVMGLLKADFEGMAPSCGRSNVVLFGGYYGFIPSGTPVNFCALTNQYQYRSNSLPLIQALPGTDTARRTNVLQKFFLLTRENTTWTAVGYVVDTASTNYFNPLYRFAMTTNMSVPNAPWVLYTNFLGCSRLPISVSPTNSPLSHLQDGVLQLTVRAYDLDGYWMTNTLVTNAYAGYWRTNRNIRFQPPAWGEINCYLFSNMLPASVSVELGVLEDHSIQRVEALADNPVAQLMYLSNHVGQVHLFRQRILIRNVDPSAWQ